MNAHAHDGALNCPAMAPCDDALSSRRLLAIVAVRAAQAELDRIAMATDEPDARDVDAADCLDAAHDLLAQVVMA